MKVNLEDTVTDWRQYIIPEVLTGGYRVDINHMVRQTSNTLKIFNLWEQSSHQLALFEHFL